MSNPPDQKFLNRYFRSVYNKLEADALLFNRRLPHEGLKGSENERALAEVIRGFLPSRYGVEDNVLVIDRHGNSSRQCDIVIFDDFQFPKYLRKVYPIETVHAVIEVKTELTKQQASGALENRRALQALDSDPALTPYWQNKSKEQNIRHLPPVHCIFGYRSSTEDFSTFARWFDDPCDSVPPNAEGLYHVPFNRFLVCALDKGIIFDRGDMHLAQWLSVAEEKHNERNFPVTADGYRLEVDPAKALFSFLHTLWTMIEQSPRHPGFDIRSYMDFDLGSFIPFNSDGKIRNS